MAYRLASAIVTGSIRATRLLPEAPCHSSPASAPASRPRASSPRRPAAALPPTVQPKPARRGSTSPLTPRSRPSAGPLSWRQPTGPSPCAAQPPSSRRLKGIRVSRSSTCALQPPTRPWRSPGQRTCRTTNGCSRLSPPIPTGRAGPTGAATRTRPRLTRSAASPRSPSAPATCGTSPSTT